MLMGDYSDEKSKTKNTTFIGDDAAVAYLSMEYIDAADRRHRARSRREGRAARAAPVCWLGCIGAVGCVVRRAAGWRRRGEVSQPPIPPPPPLPV